MKEPKKNLKVVQTCALTKCVRTKDILTQQKVGIKDELLKRNASLCLEEVLWGKN